MVNAKLLLHFFDPDAIKLVEPFGNGHINDTYKVTLLIGGKEQTFLLQRFNDVVFQQPLAVMENIECVASHLSQQDYPLKILKPYKTKKQTFFHRDDSGNLWRVFDFFDGTSSFEQVDTEEQAFDAAKAYGQFTRALHNLPIQSLKTTIPDFHNGPKRIADFKQAVQQAIPERLKAVKEELRLISSYEHIFNKVSCLNVPLRAIHHDTKINNILFDRVSKKPAAVVDLDTVMPGILLSDFGDMVRTFTCLAAEDEADLRKVNVREPIYEALKTGFLSSMQDVMTEEEKASLETAGPWLTLMQAVRFLGDYLIGDPYYKIKYKDHNLVRAKNQLILFQSMLKRRSDLKIC